jgi:hypothetical protein
MTERYWTASRSPFLIDWSDMTATIRLLAGLLLWLALSRVYAQSSLPVVPFTAGYTVYAKGMALGNGELKLIDDGRGRYRMRSRLQPEGFAALLISDTISEDVNGVVRDGIPYPQAYLQHHTSRTEDRIVQLQFDWQNGTAAASYSEDGEQQNASLAVSPGAVDPLSLHLLVIANLQRGLRPAQYTMLNKTESRQYTVHYHDGETLQTPLGKLRVLRVTQSRAGSSLETVFWFASDYSYLPAQIAQYKKGKEQIRM